MFFIGPDFNWSLVMCCKVKIVHPKFSAALCHWFSLQLWINSIFLPLNSSTYSQNQIKVTNFFATSFHLTVSSWETRRVFWKCDDCKSLYGSMTDHTQPHTPPPHCFAELLLAHIPPSNPLPPSLSRPGVSVQPDSTTKAALVENWLPTPSELTPSAPTQR